MSDQVSETSLMTKPNIEVDPIDLLNGPTRPTPVANVEAAPVLPAVGQLFGAMNRRGLRYCHWKSNLRLDKALSGRTDLDLLVDPNQRQAFKRLLAEFDVRETQAAAGREYPGLENYIGFDDSSGRLFHLHVHYELVLGEQFVKNYRLPLEDLFLDSASIYKGVKIPAPALELAIFSVRALLKYRDRDAVKDILNIRSPGLPAYVLMEVNSLLEQTSKEKLASMLAQVDGVIPAEVVWNFIDVATQSPRAGKRLFELRRQVRRALRPYQRHGRLMASALYLREMVRRRKRFRLSAASGKMIFSGGGTAMALVGADGSGKSTMTQALNEWLSWKLDVRLYYLGSKQPSLRSRLLYRVFRLARRSQRIVSNLTGESRFPARFLAKLRQTMLDAHSLSIGYERLDRFRAGRAAAAAGPVVIFDRFPLKAPLDGPRIYPNSGTYSRTDAAPGFAIFSRTMARTERRLYDEIDAPDFFAVLRVSPVVSISRKPDHDLAAIKAKCQAIDEFIHTKNEVDVLVIDADQPYEDVLLNLKRQLWQKLRTENGPVVGGSS